MSELIRPTISLTYPKRKGQHLLELFGKVAACVVVCGTFFWLGQQFAAPSTEAVAVTSRIAKDDGLASSSKADKTTLMAGVDATAFENKELDGIQIQNFTLKPDAVVPGELDYELELINNGAKLLGEMKLVVQGEMDGKPMVWTYPDDARPSDQHIRLNVSRYLKTAGAVQLPSKFVPQKAALKLQQENGLRASRVVQIVGNANNGLPYR